MSEFRTTVLVRIDRGLRDRLAAMAKPLWSYGGDQGPKEPIGKVIERLVDQARSTPRRSTRRGRRRRARR